MTLHPMFGYVHQGRDLTDAATYEAARKPFGQAAELPPFAFYAKAFADLEDEKIWTRNWICIGHAARIANSGDVLPYTVGNHGIHVQRQPDGSLAGRFNFAQHGGCRFVPNQCQTGKKTKCSYTACGYSRDRDVMLAAADGSATGDMGQYLGSVPERLMPVHVHQWGPFIFVNLDFDAGAGAAYFAPLDALCREYFAAESRHVARHKLEVQSNWKIPAMRFIGGYRLPPEARRFDLVDISLVDRCVSAGARYWAFSVSPSRTEVVSGLALRRGWTSFCYVYPNLLLAFCDDHFVSVILQPTGLTSCLQYLDLVEVGSHASAARHAEVAAFWHSVLRQESDALEQLQCEFSTEPAVGAPLLACHVLSHAFQQHFLSQLLSGHKYFVNKPLYTAPGRALNAGR